MIRVLVKSRRATVRRPNAFIIFNIFRRFARTAAHCLSCCFQYRARERSTYIMIHRVSIGRHAETSTRSTGRRRHWTASRRRRRSAHVIVDYQRPTSLTTTGARRVRACGTGGSKGSHVPPVRGLPLPPKHK